MVNLYYEAKCNWVKDPFKLMLIDFTHKQGCTELIFEYNGITYMYEYISSSSYGFRQLYQKGDNGFIRIYSDCYISKSDNVNCVNLCEAASKFAIYCQENIKVEGNNITVENPKYKRDGIHR